jgi:K+-transporting ATPase KdpF subunit
MTAEMFWGAVLTVALVAYLIYALFHPEKF